MRKKFYLIATSIFLMFLYAFTLQPKWVDFLSNKVYSTFQNKYPEKEPYLESNLGPLSKKVQESNSYHHSLKATSGSPRLMPFPGPDYIQP